MHVSKTHGYSFNTFHLYHLMTIIKDIQMQKSPDLSVYIIVDHLTKNEKTENKNKVNKQNYSVISHRSKMSNSFHRSIQNDCLEFCFETDSGSSLCLGTKSLINVCPWWREKEALHLPGITIFIVGNYMTEIKQFKSNHLTNSPQTSPTSMQECIQ